MRPGLVSATLAVSALALTVGCSGESSSLNEAAAAPAPPATRAPINLGEVKLPPLTFSTPDANGLISADITSEALFDKDSTELKPETEAIVGQLAGRLSATPSSVRVDGYTDGVGSAEHNLELSRLRAEALAARISGLGTAKSVLACGHGEAGTDEDSEDPTARRVTITLGAADTPMECS